MKIFITGGTGFLGKSVVKRLLADNKELHMLVRSPEKAEHINNSNVNLIKGTLENIHEWQHKLAGMDVVIHMAAPVVFWGKWSMYQKLVIDATVDLLKYTEMNKVKKFIYISSESVLQDKKDLLNIDESCPYPKEPNSYYGKSKMIAEKKILESPSKVERIILRPTFIWGNEVAAIQAMISKVKQGTFSWIDHGNTIIEMVHVDNVAEAIALAVHKGKDKDVLFVTDDNPKKAKEFFTDMLSTQGIAIPDKSLPRFIARPVASVTEFMWRVLKLKNDPPITRFDLAFVSMPRSYRIDQIKNKLGYKPVVSYQEGLERMKKI
ncbi:NAD-dependent epimerase/dehydratase family protein [Paenibacillus sp. CGMCC 1.18879]|uniref:NAD-dependent epimerase/dehydratase family protein n=1 Tax=Paenibacillus sp. CGMCC 1.18879 TaxID=2834466 RepID=UPI001CA9B3F0|nr:NAD-dependent epimerase/dehydratase family protein [Paenibacillus sp. CGMCC 1.18879]MBY9079356.1 NAD-dependent epimerase/dehydratase family protein [Paenibacillus sp. CGMCC 1.18879]